MDPLFWELHSGLVHEAPGSAEETRRALAMTGLTGPLSILDAGSGPGAASVTLLQALPEARVLAMDLYQPFLDAAQERAALAGCGDRLSVKCGDMAVPPVDEGALDLIWSEGTVYALGVETALNAWRSFLAPGGRIVFSELVWTAANPHPEARAFWEAEYPAMTDRNGVAAQISDAKMQILGDFELPETAWEAYYGPLAERTDDLAVQHGNDHPVILETRAEIAMRRDHGNDFAYRFFAVAP